MKKSFVFLLFTLVLFNSCMKVEPQEEIDDQIIQSYLKSKSIVAVKDPSGLYYLSMKEGTGVQATPTSKVEVKYKGMLTNGTIFDMTQTDKTYTSNLNELIPGWVIGISKMREGGKSMLFIPSGLAYGSMSVGGVIPQNSVLIFEVELVKVF